MVVGTHDGEKLHRYHVSDRKQRAEQEVARKDHPPLNPTLRDLLLPTLPHILGSHDCHKQTCRLESKKQYYREPMGDIPQHHQEAVSLLHGKLNLFEPIVTSTGQG